MSTQVGIDASGEILSKEFIACHTVGLMFWFIRKKLVGSYLFLSATNRS
jgi:hypothetical protein